MALAKAAAVTAAAVAAWEMAEAGAKEEEGVAEVQEVAGKVSEAVGV